MDECDDVKDDYDDDEKDFDYKNGCELLTDDVQVNDEGYGV